jgi:hypothetical protein
MLDHGEGQLRALVFAAGGRDQALLGPPQAIPNRPGLPAATQLPLAGGALERVLVVAETSVVHVRSSSGVCALLQGDRLLQVAGGSPGCALDQLVAPGSYSLRVRPFGALSLAGSLSWTREPVVALADGVGPESWLSAGEARLFRFEVASPGHVGLGLQVAADTLQCDVLDADQKAIGHGCQQFLSLQPGSYVLAVRAPIGNQPARFKPVVVGLAGSKMEVPVSYLQDFFQRIRGQP